VSRQIAISDGVSYALDMDIIGHTQKLVHIGKNVAFPFALDISTEAGEAAPVALQFAISYSRELARYAVRKVTVGDSHSDSPWNTNSGNQTDVDVPEVTGTLVRAIPFQEIVTQGLSRIRYFDLASNRSSAHTAMAFVPPDRDDMIRRGPDFACLESVALLYRIAETLNFRPAKHVETALNIPYPTASNWISRARKQDAFSEVTFVDGKDSSVSYSEELVFPVSLQKKRS
jgi:hypothetical protein